MAARNRFPIVVAGVLVAAFAVVLLAMLAFDGGGGSSGGAKVTTVDGIESSTGDAGAPPQRDLDGRLRCAAEIGVLRAEGQLTNHATTPADYTLRVRWEDGAATLGEGVTTVAAVPPGRQVAFEASTPGSGVSSMSCRVVRVDRTPAASG